MEDRRKIVVPLGHEPETPHFDAEETLLSARPVVPIARAESAPVFNHSQAAPVRPPFYKRSLFLSLVVVAAVGIGLMAGLAIARYRYAQRTAAPVAAQPTQAPVASDTRTAATVQPEQQAQAPTLPEVKIEEKTTADDEGTKDDAKTATASEDSARAREGSEEKGTADRDDNVRTATPPPAAAPRERKRADEADEGQDAPRTQRRERRVRERADEADIPRRIERASEQINRIREIFEGRQQRP